MAKRPTVETGQNVIVVDPIADRVVRTTRNLDFMKASFVHAGSTARYVEVMLQPEFNDKQSQLKHSRMLWVEALALVENRVPLVQMAVGILLLIRLIACSPWLLEIIAVGGERIILKWLLIADIGQRLA